MNSKDQAYTLQLIKNSRHVIDMIAAINTEFLSGADSSPELVAAVFEDLLRIAESLKGERNGALATWTLHHDGQQKSVVVELRVIGEDA